MFRSKSTDVCWGRRCVIVPFVATAAVLTAPSAHGDCCVPGECLASVSVEQCDILGGVYVFSCQTYNVFDQVSLPITDFNSTTATITLPQNAGSVIDVEVRLNITHSYVGDLCATLSHGGVTVLLLSRPGFAGQCNFTGCCGCSAQNYSNVVLSDLGTGGPIETACVNNLSSPPAYTPDEPLSAFSGLSAFGNWTLTISDHAGALTGMLDSWTLKVNTACACPGTGDCFEANGTIGCEDAMCCGLICTIDPFCCNTTWDALCATEAEANCRDCAGDANKSGTVDVDDLIEVILNWGECRSSAPTSAQSSLQGGGRSPRAGE